MPSASAEAILLAMIAIRRFDEEAAWIAALIDDMLGAVLSAESENRRAVLFV